MQGDLNAGRSLLKEAGYAGQEVVILNPTNNIIGPCGEVTYDLLKELGMNVDLQETDCAAAPEQPQAGGRRRTVDHPHGMA